MAKKLSKEEWRKKRRIRRNVILATMIALLFLVIASITFIVIRSLQMEYGTGKVKQETLTDTLSDGVKVRLDYLTPNDYSRPQTSLKRVKGVVVHYTANPGTSAANNRSYFEGLAQTKTTYASSHYIIGLEGEILQCIPLTEQSFASNDRNRDTISIECCHPDKTGKFNEETYDSLVSLTAALCLELDLKEEDIIRHYDITKKLCPLYYVEHEDAWENFKDDVMDEVTDRLSQQRTQ